MYRVAACQVNSGADKAANLQIASELIDEAAAVGADVIALPESFNFLTDGDSMVSGAEPITGPTAQFLAGKAREHGVYIHGGSIAEAIPGSERVRNTTLVFAPEGDLIANYSKIHLFDLDLPGRAQSQEAATVEPGSDMVTVETEHGIFGLTICYDVRFPELYRALALAGARLIFQPSAFTRVTGEAHWEVLIRSRAIENQVFVVSPAQFGEFGSGHKTYGNSMIVDPWGTVLARAGDDEPGVIYADVDPGAQDRTRSALPVFEHRRPEVYDRPVRHDQ